MLLTPEELLLSAPCVGDDDDGAPSDTGVCRSRSVDTEPHGDVDDDVDGGDGHG